MLLSHNKVQISKINIDMEEEDEDHDYEVRPHVSGNQRIGFINRNLQ
jgi:hypothetical protein